MFHEKEVGNIDAVLNCEPENISQVLDDIVAKGNGEFSFESTILYMVALHRTVFTDDLPMSIKQEMSSHLTTCLSEGLMDSENSVFNLIPSTYLFQLLFSLRSIGVEIDQIIENIDLTLYEDGLANLFKFGNFNDASFIENLRYFYSKLNKDRHFHGLSGIAKASAQVHNFSSCEIFIPKIKDKQDKLEVVNSLALAYLECNETAKALELPDLIKDTKGRAFLLSNISGFLLKNGLSDFALNLLKTETDQLVRFEIVIQIIHYNINKDNHKIIYVLIDEAIQISRNIEDLYIKARCFAKLATIQMRLNWEQEIRIHIGDVIFIIEDNLNFKEGCMAFNNLFTQLVINDRFDIADDLLRKRWGGVNCFGQWEFDSNLSADINTAILKILKHIKKLVHEDERTICKTNQDEISRLYECTFRTISLLQDFSEEDYLLHEIACSQAENGFFDETIETQNLIKDKDYKKHVAIVTPLYACGRGYIEKAIGLTNAIEIHEHKSEAQLIMAPILFNNGFRNEAKHFLRSWAIYQTIKDQHWENI